MNIDEKILAELKAIRENQETVIVLLMKQMMEHKKFEAVVSIKELSEMINRSLGRSGG